jgi:alkyldihydroxyacetonephosphate synthase
VADPPMMRWWGWGDPASPAALPATAVRFLAETVGTAARPRPPVALGRVKLAPPALSARALQALREIVGRDGVRDDHAERVAHAAGKSYPDLLRLRAGLPDGAPDAVILPVAPEQVRGVLECCAGFSVAVVPFGGGTSVVGGLAPRRGGQEGVVSLDMRRMGQVLDLDRESLTVLVGAGIRASALERYLGERGLTLGHFPQSFEYASLGGCVATRSVGQASSGYGGIARMVLGLRLSSPVGEIELPAVPASAAGPGLRQLLVGSEGTLGVISALALRVRAAPSERVYEGVFFEDFESGLSALRALAQSRSSPEVVRLSDESETGLSLKLTEPSRASVEGLERRLARLYLGIRGYRSPGCLAILGFEGEREEIALRRERALATARQNGGLAVGRSPGEAWLRTRFSAPYLRDELLTHGVLVETLETAAQWSQLTRLHREVGDAIAQALSRQGTPGLVMCHVSHLYPTGASLYFTLLARQREGDELGQWETVKDAATRAILDGGGTLSHHHGVGIDHAAWLEEELGSTAVAALRALKLELDPTGIMNPGKLLPPSRSG